VIYVVNFQTNRRKENDKIRNHWSIDWSIESDDNFKNSVNETIARSVSW